MHPRIVAAAAQSLLARGRVQNADRPVCEGYGKAAPVWSERDLLHKVSRRPIISLLGLGKRQPFLTGCQLPQTTGVGHRVQTIALSASSPRDGQERPAVGRKRGLGKGLQR